MTTPVFPSLLQEVIFWAAFAATIVELAWLGKAQRTFRSRESLKKRQSEIAIYITLLSIIVVPLVLGYARGGVLPNWLFYPGIALFLVGNLFTLWSRSVLGRFWSGEVRVLSDHSVVQAGPYRLIRHPMYTGQLLMYIGFGLAL